MAGKDARTKWKVTLKERLRSAARVLVASYLGLCLFLFLAQDRLLFHQPRLSLADAAQLLRDYSNIKEERLRVAEHVTLHGWFARQSFDAKQPLIIYFGGNGEEVSHFAWDVEQLPGWAMVFFNYRGYGLSEGKPGGGGALPRRAGHLRSIRDASGYRSAPDCGHGSQPRFRRSHLPGAAPARGGPCPHYPL